MCFIRFFLAFSFLLTWYWPCWSRQSRESLIFQEGAHALLAHQNVVIVGKSGSGQPCTKCIDGALTQRSGRESVRRACHDGIKGRLVDAVPEFGAVLFVSLQVLNNKCFEQKRFILFR